MGLKKPYCTADVATAYVLVLIDLSGESFKVFPFLVLVLESFLLSVFFFGFGLFSWNFPGNLWRIHDLTYVHHRTE